MKRFSLIMLCAAMPMLAQRTSTFQASVRGSGNSGKCTIEVDVDGVAEVEIRGTTGLLRTVSGRPARWIRFQCSAPFPAGGMGSFNFRGIDGRGRQSLLRDPRDNRGVAVIGIEDPQGGAEGYTFDIEWRDGYFGNNWPSGGSRVGSEPRSGGRRDTARAVRICEDAVRGRADRDFGVRNVDFERIEMDNGPGRNDWVIGTLRDSGRRDRYEFSCSVDFNNGSVRTVNLRRR